MPPTLHPAKGRRKNAGSCSAYAQAIDRAVREVGAHSARAPEATLSDCLASAQLTGSDTAAEKETVTLLTMHAAKGLEFEAVIITGVEVGLMPLCGATSNRAIEEERRLLYVAMTRARRQLTLIHARWRLVGGLVRESEASIFLSSLGAASKCR